jgi:hypothetical protein
MKALRVGSANSSERWLVSHYSEALQYLPSLYLYLYFTSKPLRSFKYVSNTVEPR